MKILLVSPPIYDFAAYDFWMKPLGILYISSILKEKGHKVYLIDATNRFDSYYSEVKSDRFGRGKINAKTVLKPEILKGIPRRYRRYGLPRKIIIKKIKEFDPEVVMVSCTMTYWYPGVVEIKKILDSLPIKPTLLLGGIYPRLLPIHANSLGFDRVYTGSGGFIDEIGVEIPDDFSRFPPPDYSHYENLEYAAIATSLGCPFFCPYCASPNLYGKKQNKEAEQVIEEIEYLYKKEIHKFAFYDDALLITEDRFVNLCQKIKERGISANFFTPNGLHSRFLTREVAQWMHKVGFKEPRISLETTDEDLQKRFSIKTTNGEFIRAVENLSTTGYNKKHIYTYLLAGLPQFSFPSVRKSILDVARIGVKVSLAEFSPIPGTPMEQELPDPLLTNNTAFYYYKGMGKEMERIKQLVKWANKGIDLGISIKEIKDYL